MEPRPQVSMGQQVHPKTGHEVRERPREPGLQLQVAQDQHGDQGRPDLHFHRVGAGAHQGLDREILLEGLEEQFDLPAVFVDLGNGGGPERELIGQKDQDLFCLGAPALHPTQEHRALLLRLRAGETDRVVVENRPALRKRMLLDHLVDGMVLHAGATHHAATAPAGSQSPGSRSSLPDSDPRSGSAPRPPSQRQGDWSFCEMDPPDYQTQEVVGRKTGT